MGKSAHTLFIPFNPDPGHHWLVRRRLTEVGRYPSQEAAVRGAFEHLRRQSVDMPDMAPDVRVQTEDGQWVAAEEPAP